MTLLAQDIDFPKLTQQLLDQGEAHLPDGRAITLAFEPTDAYLIGRWLDDDGILIASHDDIHGDFCFSYTCPEAGWQHIDDAMNDRGESVWWLAPAAADADMLYDVSQVIARELQVGVLHICFDGLTQRQGAVLDAPARRWASPLGAMLAQLLTDENLLTAADRFHMAVATSGRSPASLALGDD